MEFDETNVQVVMKQVKAKNPTIESEKEWNNLQLVMSVFVGNKHVHYLSFHNLRHRYA